MPDLLYERPLFFLGTIDFGIDFIGVKYLHGYYVNQ